MNRLCLARSSCLVVAALLTLSAASCGGPKRKTTYPTEGTLLIGGKPFGGLTVFFYSTDTAETEPTKPFATTNADGTFTLTTTAANDGAPAGEYVVTVIYEPLDSPLARAKRVKPPRFDKKYSDPKTSPLRAKIENKPKNVLEPFDLK